MTRPTNLKLLGSFKIPYRFPSINTYINECRRHRKAGNALKRECTDIAGMHAISNGIKPVRQPVIIGLRFLEPDKKRDVDNVYSGAKFILDGLVRANILPDDSQKWVVDVGYDISHVDSPKKAGVVVRIFGIENL